MSPLPLFSPFQVGTYPNIIIFFVSSISMSSTIFYPLIYKKKIIFFIISFLAFEQKNIHKNQPFFCLNEQKLYFGRFFFCYLGQG